jgi:alkylresorcinol/alkylpyrone synthase
MDWTRGVLRDYGNMSSTTVLFVIERYLSGRGTGRGGYGLVSALGPGFCSESVLLGL